MDRLKAMSAFAHTVELGSFSAAADSLHTTQSNISKLVALLERDLGVRLLERSARALVLTAQGERYLPRVRLILSAVDAARQDLAASRSELSGTIRIAASWAFGRTQIIPVLNGLMQHHPSLDIDLRLSDQTVNLVREGVDLAFRVAHLKDSDLIARRIGQTRRLTVAAPDYLTRHGTPRSPEDLEQHHCIYHTGIGLPRIWRFRRGTRTISVRILGRFQANASEAIREAAVNGLGVALLPEWMLSADIEAGRLRVLLDRYQTAPLPIHAVMSRNNRGSTRIKAVLEYFETRFTSTFGDVSGRATQE